VFNSSFLLRIINTNFHFQNFWDMNDMLVAGWLQMLRVE